MRKKSHSVTRESRISPPREERRDDQDFPFQHHHNLLFADCPHTQLKLVLVKLSDSSCSTYAIASIPRLPTSKVASHHTSERAHCSDSTAQHGGHRWYVFRQSPSLSRRNHSYASPTFNMIAPYPLHFKCTILAYRNGVCLCSLHHFPPS